jgi:hypothetical protein
MGARLQKSRTRALRVDDWGGWRIVSNTGRTLIGERWELTLDQVDDWVTAREAELEALRTSTMEKTAERKGRG